MQQQAFNPMQDAQILNDALVKNKDKEKIIQIVTHRSNEQRQLIFQAYNTQYQQNIFDVFRTNLSGNFKDAVMALFYTPVDYDCYQIHKAVEGFGTNEDTLIEVIATKSNESLIALRQRFQQLFNQDLIQVIKSETSGHLQKILISLLQADRSINKIPNEQECIESAKRLFDSQKEKKEFLYNAFIYVFTQKSREELAAICRIYYQQNSKTLLEVVENYFSGDGRRVLKAIIYSLLSPSEYFAYRINKDLNSFLVNDNILIRILVSRDEIDIYRIKRYYQEKYNISLYNHLKEKISGDSAMLHDLDTAREMAEQNEKIIRNDYFHLFLRGLSINP